MNILFLEFLDKIISILKIQNKKLTAHEITVLFITDDFYFLYKKDFQINNYLPILVKDGYVKETTELSKIEGFPDSKIKYYSLTVKGLEFTGYVDNHYNELSTEQQNKEILENQSSLNKSIMLTNASVRSTNTRMFYLTFVIAFGTVVSAIYYLIEILKFYNLLCACSEK
ncbi:hypothetical protein [Flavobacterium eburneipallidum]|uniref:hypothetical protein n=1 Tax=Flavobacterium eburneipallidum TaxID=3003263 RepID=UPI0022ABEE76|nr:hypothetical protein [Flavobacterium eburneipallidum]